MVRKLALLVLSSCLSTVINAEPERPLVVKVESWPCREEGLTTTLRGSGVVFEADGRTLVLTSSHVVYNALGSNDYCHAVKTEAGERVAARLEAVNFGNGLALLVLGRALPDALSWASLDQARLQYFADPTSPDLPRVLDLAGFRHAELTRLVSWDAKLLADKSQSFVLPLVTSFLQLESYSEYGMSGGGAFARGNEQSDYLGLLSHHYFFTREGQLAELGRVDPRAKAVGNQKEGSFVSLVVPLPTILDWHALIEREGAMQASWPQDPGFQEKGLVSVVLEDVRLTERNCFGSDIGGDGIGIGGDGIGIGGDGIGIGGVAEAPRPTNDEKLGCHIEVRRAKQRAPLPHGLERLAPWLAEVSQKVAERDDLVIADLKHRGSVIPVRGLASLLSVMVNEGAQPLIITAEKLAWRRAEANSKVQARCRLDLKGFTESVELGCRDIKARKVWSARSVARVHADDVDGYCRNYGGGKAGFRVPSVAELEALARSGMGAYILPDGQEAAYWAMIESETRHTLASGEQVHTCHRPKVYAKLDGSLQSIAFRTVRKGPRGDVIASERLFHERDWVVCVKDERAPTTATERLVRQQTALFSHCLAPVK